MRQGPGAKLIVYLITLLNGKCGGAGKNFIIIFITGSDLLTTSLKLSLTLHQKDLILVKIGRYLFKVLKLDYVTHCRFFRNHFLLGSQFF